MSKVTAGKNNGVYGKHHSEKSKKLCSEANLGNKYCEGRTLSEDTKIKISKSNSGKRRTDEFKLEASKRVSGVKNPMYGKHTLKKLSKRYLQIFLIQKKEKFECPYCNKKVDLGNFNRWHNENCKENPNITKENLDKRTHWNKNRRFNDYPEREYAQVSGSGRHP